MIPYMNATLTAVTPAATSDDYDHASTYGAARWTGSVGVYVAEERVEELSAGRQDEVLQTRLEMPYTGPGVLVERGDKLTYTLDGETVNRFAGTITRAPLMGRVRVLLVDA